jgi:flagellar hook-associated protein 1 FlgK
MGLPVNFSMFNAHRGLLAAQTALNTISHNISNMNTPGYSRQRAEQTAYIPYTYMNPHSKMFAGQVGQGPMVSEISRARDVFADNQFRLVNSQLGKDAAIHRNLQLVESIVGENTESGLSDSIQRFFDAAQEMSLNPESNAARISYLNSASDLINNFQFRAEQLQELQNRLVSSSSPSELSVRVDQVNAKLEAIAQINHQIITVTPTGLQPNDLLDKRDMLLDELSQLIDFEVTTLPNDQISIDIAGITMLTRNKVHDTLELAANPGPAPPSDAVPTLVRTANGGVVLNNGGANEIKGGEIRGILDVAGNTGTMSSVHSTLNDLNTLLTQIVNEVNAIQLAGRDLNGDLATEPIFTPPAPVTPPLAIFQYEVNADILADPKLLAAAIDDPTVVAPAPIPGFAGTGDGRNALLLAQLKDKVIAGLGGTKIDSFLNNTVTKVGAETKSYATRTANGASLLNSVDLRRQQVSGVNLDEELADMIRYQRAFEASSKVIRMMDEITQGILALKQ